MKCCVFSARHGHDRGDVGCSSRLCVILPTNLQLTKQESGLRSGPQTQAAV